MPPFTALVAFSTSALMHARHRTARGKLQTMENSKQRITLTGKGISWGHFSEILRDGLQTVFFKMSKENVRFELESAILVHFKRNAPQMHAFHYENTETSFLFYPYHQVRSFIYERPNSNYHESLVTNNLPNLKLKNIQPLLLIRAKKSANSVLVCLKLTLFQVMSGT